MVRIYHHSLGQPTLPETWRRFFRHWKDGRTGAILQLSRSVDVGWCWHQRSDEDGKIVSYHHLNVNKTRTLKRSCAIWLHTDDSEKCPHVDHIQQAALFKHKDMSQNTSSSFLPWLSYCDPARYNLSPKPVTRPGINIMCKKQKQRASQWSISHTCDTLRRYQRPSLYARIVQQEFPQNGETAAAKCLIHKSLGCILCWSLGGPLFQSNTVFKWICCLKVESRK